MEPAKIEDVEKMVRACDGKMVGRRDKAAMHFLMDTGVRASEMIAVTMEDIDLMSGEVLIRAGKGRKPRFVFLGKRTRRSLRQYLKLRTDKNAAP